MRPFLLALCLTFVPFASHSQEIRIGHLETADDKGPNWLFYHCVQAEQRLICNAFQTLIFREANSSTCNVLNDHSRQTFTWNQAANSWTSREGPSGPCGRLSNGTLDHDPSSPKFWRYVERKTTTKPEGILPNGMACRQFPDITLNYTWRASEADLGCTKFKNLMN